MRSLLLAPLCLALSAIPAAPAERGQPLDAAKPCPRYGQGFVEVPGTGSCIRISGRVRSSYGVSGRRVSRDDIAGFGSSARISADTRTDTDYGPVRTFVRLKAGAGAPDRR